MDRSRVIVGKENRASTAITLTIGQRADRNIYDERVHTTFSPIPISALETARPPHGACRLSLADATVLAKNSNVPDAFNGLTTSANAAVFLGDYTLSRLSRRTVDTVDNISYTDVKGNWWHLNKEFEAGDGNRTLHLPAIGPFHIPAGHMLVPVKELNPNGEDGVSAILIDFRQTSGSLSNAQVTPTFFTLKPGLYQSMAEVVRGIAENLSRTYHQHHHAVKPTIILARPDVSFVPTESGGMNLVFKPPETSFAAYKMKGSETIYLNPAVWRVHDLTKSLTPMLSMSSVLSNSFVFWNPPPNISKADESSFALTYRFYNHTGFESRAPTLPSAKLGIEEAVVKSEVVVQTFVIGVSGASDNLHFDNGGMNGSLTLVSTDGLCTVLCLELPNNHDGSVKAPNLTALKTNDIVSVNAHYSLEGKDLAEQSYLTGEILRYAALSGHLVNTDYAIDIYASAGSLRPLSTDGKAGHDSVLVLQKSYDHPLRSYPSKPDGTSFDLSKMSLVLSLTNSNGDIIPIAPGSRITLSLLACNLERL